MWPPVTRPESPARHEHAGQRSSWGFRCLPRLSGGNAPLPIVACRVGTTATPGARAPSCGCCRSSTLHGAPSSSLPLSRRVCLCPERLAPSRGSWPAAGGGPPRVGPRRRRLRAAGHRERRLTRGGTRGGRPGSAAPGGVSPLGVRAPGGVTRASNTVAGRRPGIEYRGGTRVHPPDIEAEFTEQHGIRAANSLDGSNAVELVFRYNEIRGTEDRGPGNRPENPQDGSRGNQPKRDHGRTMPELENNSRAR
jgi:hypothetical protein